MLTSHTVRILKLLFYCFLIRSERIDKSLVLCIKCIIFLTPFKILSLIFGFCQFTMIRLDVILFVLILFFVC